jgi:hypothetical protein
MNDGHGADNAWTACADSAAKPDLNAISAIMAGANDGQWTEAGMGI